jgi:Rrf2 family protein
MRVSAKADYAVRAAAEVAASADQFPVKADRIAAAQGIPLSFLENIFAELRHAGLIRSRSGKDGGYWLARPPEEISLAEVIRAVDGPLASVRGERPEALSYDGAATRLRDVWVALRANIRGVLEVVTLADLAAGELPIGVAEMIDEPEAWRPH